MNQKDGAVQGRAERVQHKGRDPVWQLAPAPAIHALEPARDQQRGAAGFGSRSGQEPGEIVQPGSDQGAKLNHLAFFHLVGFIVASAIATVN